jgi:CheY-like chemotaxis protein
VGIIITESERLTSLINDVLDIAKLEAGKVEWKQEKVAIADIIERAISATSSLIEKKGLETIRELDTDLPEVIVDTNRLIQVVINLISNAVKFTEKGTITFRACQEPTRIRVSIIDTGIGIPESELSNVFEKFKQVGNTLTDKPKGTGLGLPICKQIVEHHGGEIGVLQSGARGGSEFYFTLPIGDSPATFNVKLDMKEFAEQIPELGFAVTDQNGRKKNILVVDDEINICQLLGDHLQDKGYKVTIATDSVEAVRLAKINKPDLITLDVRMPRLDGFDVAAVLKNNPITNTIPIIIISVEEDSERGYLIGVDKQLIKPIDMDELLKEVDSLTSTQRT